MFEYVILASVIAAGIMGIDTELDKTRSFISQLQKVKPGNLFGLGGNWTGQKAVNKFNSSYNYYSRVWTGEKGSLNTVSLFPDV